MRNYSSSVEVSPGSSPTSLARRTLRIILPLLVFGGGYLLLVRRQVILAHWRAKVVQLALIMGGALLLSVPFYLPLVRDTLDPSRSAYLSRESAAGAAQLAQADLQAVIGDDAANGAKTEGEVGLAKLLHDDLGRSVLPFPVRGAPAQNPALLSPALARAVHSLLRFPIEKTNHRMAVTGGILAAESAALLKELFHSRRIRRRLLYFYPEPYLSGD